MSVLTENTDQLKTLCSQHKVNKLYAFGSVLTPEFDKKAESDIDFFINMLEGLPPLEKGEEILSLWLELEKLFGRKIDLLTDTSIQNPYLLAEINKTKQLVYDRQG